MCCNTVGIALLLEVLGDTLLSQNQSSSPCVSSPSCLLTAPLSHALGLGATRRGWAAAALAQGLGCSCAVHIWGGMEAAALAPCPLSLLFRRFKCSCVLKLPNHV